MNTTFLIIVISSLVALTTVNWAYFKILQIAKEKNIVDNPDARKLQKRPIPVMGGVAVFIGVVAGVLCGMALQSVLGHNVNGSVMAVICAMMVMLYVGSMDDIVGLTPRCRLIIEVLTILGLIYATGVCVDTFHGLWGVDRFSWYIGVPLTVFGGVGIINSINMIDGVNGLSSGLCIACSVMFGCVFIKTHDTANAVLAFTMAASLFPFLMHNVFGNRSKMFIGDAGTMIMGVLLTWFTMSVLHADSAISYYGSTTKVNLIALSLAIMSVPVADTLRVMSMRILKKKSPFQPDKTHLHHVFINVGVSHSVTSLTEIFIDILIVGIWALSVICGASMEMQLYIVIALCIIFVGGTYVFIHYHVKHHTPFMHRLAHFSVATHLGHKHWWMFLQNWLDSPEKEEKNASEAAQIRADHLARRFEHVDPTNFKEVDRKKVYEFMKGKAEVFVDDIRKRSGADKMRVYAIIFEGEQEGYINVITRDSWGAPVIVSLE